MLHTMVSLALAFVLVPPPAPAPAAAPATTEARPNIVVLLLEDLPGDGDALLARMPRVNTVLMERGLRFQNAYSNDPLCCPGRANFLTGLYTHHHGVVRNDALLFQPDETIATALDRAGYWTAYAGKYMHRTHHLADKLPPGWDRFAATSFGYYADWWVQGASAGRASEYSTDVLAEYAVRWLREAPSTEPVFMVLSPYAPHRDKTRVTKAGFGIALPAPRHAGDPRCDGIGVRRSPAWDEEDVSDKPEYVRALPRLEAAGWPLAHACRALLSVDEMFEAVRRELVASGRIRDTLFVLVADNGVGWGDHRIHDKAVPYTTRIPLYVRYRSAQSADIGHHVSMVDLAPTLAEAGGATLGPYPTGQSAPDGLSLLATITSRGETAPQREALLEEHRAPAGLLNATHKVPPWWALRTTDGRWHYVEYETGERELYDLAADPWELENLIVQDPDTAARLAASLRGLRGDPEP